MINAEIFFSVMLAILAAKYIFLSIQALTIGSVQSRLEHLNINLNRIGSDVELNIKNLGGGLGSKLESIDSILNHMSDHTRDIKFSCEKSR